MWYVYSKKTSKTSTQKQFHKYALALKYALSMNHSQFVIYWEPTP